MSVAASSSPARSVPAREVSTHGHAYGRLAVMATLSFVSMYVLMYAMVDRFPNVVNNVNQLYMAALMAAPMVLIELVLMKSMFTNRKLNAIIATSAVILMVGSFLMIRRQVAVGDKQFLRSMIPHHAGAILMCEQASLDDQGVQDLCVKIIQSQREEIAEMKARLKQLGND
jgi:uncharacterized protein (DUF305 family)